MKAQVRQKVKELIPIQEIPTQFCKDLCYFFTDIDDTLTEKGMLPHGSYKALWQLFQNNINIIPVTGRPAGWCDHIARMWPVKAVIGENGAFYFTYNRDTKKMERIYLTTVEQRRAAFKRLEKIKEKVLTLIPKARVASDQPFRLTDLAIDISEDIKPLSKREVKKIWTIAKDFEANYKVSSIHINCWYGHFNKLKCLKKYLYDQTGKDLYALKDNIFFIGDSPNDEPLFRALPHSAAVANLKEFFLDLKFFPKYITAHSSARGFAQAVDTILKKRNS